MFLEQIIQPFAYIRIQEVKGKYVYDWIIPLFLTATCLLLTYLSGIGIGVEVNKDLIDPIINFVSNLPGFYIAALAAVATFNSRVLDQNLQTSSDTSPFLMIKVVKNCRKESKRLVLKRRTYLSCLFAYLTAISFLLVIINKLSPLFIKLSEATTWVYLLIIFLLLWQMMVITFCGLYYLGQRIHD